MKGFHRRIIGIASILILIGFALGIGGAAPAFADETKYKDPVIEVYYDYTLLKQFSKTELEGIAAAEGNQRYIYSRFNTNVMPSLDRIYAKGPTVEGILNEALLTYAQETPGSQIPAELKELKDDQTIEFRASSRSDNAYSARFLKSQLFEKRYYYPNADKELPHEGKAAKSEAFKDKIEVPPIISTEELKEDWSAPEGKPGRSLFGQLVPNEQNAPDCVQGMFRINEQAKPGKIIISSSSAQQWNPVVTTDAGTGGDVKKGTQIMFDRTCNTFQKTGGSRFWVYYTIDGTEPSIASEQYNYNNNGYGDEDEALNKPKVTEYGDLVIKAKIIGNGRPDSDVTEFHFRGVKDLVDVDIYGPSDTKVYSGETQTVTGFTFSAGEDDLVNVSAKQPETLTISGKDAGKYALPLQRGMFNVELLDSDYGLGKVTLHDGLLTIQPAKLTVVTNSAKKTFDGKALTAGGTIEGFVNEETAAFAVTGKQTNAGKSKNTYSLKWDDSAKNDNYTIQESLGELIVEMPKVKAPTLKPLTLKKKTITVKWSKVSGASGYQVYRSLKKSSGFKLVKTIKKGSTVTWKNANLAKKTYYYKVRAYRVIAGKTVYSGYSAVKYKKVK